MSVSVFVGVTVCRAWSEKDRVNEETSRGIKCCSGSNPNCLYAGIYLDVLRFIGWSSYIADDYVENFSVVDAAESARMDW